ncbi:MAG: thiL [Hydrocarboniphaga sp.]|uniref:thiamine-phosphate kinase n=1 Tax=Hydrocarboniphaga sp. TaxID=2033016 RepID=UPI00260F1F53|nr:thiamine-phosphate kinase [Hydrocarboniphaga sp.]MDB5968602.1 thiL [Hydrocarboniphaga sp.]
MDEFELIRRYFAPLSGAHEDVVLGIGDDCALLAPPAGHELAVTSDTLIAGRHFPEESLPFDIGWKSLAVNLSDLAAMGARARWFTLALALPEADERWLAGFADGLKALADEAEVSLVGGDTTRGPLTITITALGVVPAGCALRRSGARVGDRVCVSGTLGDAALALERWRAGDRDRSDDALDLRARLDRPTPRLALGEALRGLAHAAIDLSDGLAADLSHLLRASGVGAHIYGARLPSSAAFDRLAPAAERTRLQLAGGDDYELCLCIPAARLSEVRRLAQQIGVALTDIGEIQAGSGLSVLGAQCEPLAFTELGYRHFQ